MTSATRATGSMRMRRRRSRTTVPTPMLPGTPTPSGAQPAEVPRSLVTLQALDTTASPNGWIDDGGTETLGNNVDAHTDTDANNVADLPRPTRRTRRVFDFPLDLAQAPGTYKDAAVTQLVLPEQLDARQALRTGLHRGAGNFQTNNFGRGGSGNDAVQADAQDGSGTNNANFSTPPDGSPRRACRCMSSPGPTPDRDGDFDARDRAPRIHARPEQPARRRRRGHQRARDRRAWAKAGRTSTAWRC